MGGADPILSRSDAPAAQALEAAAAFATARCAGDGRPRVARTGVPASLIYSGGVTSIEDVVALNEHALEGCIVGTALYDGRLDLDLAIQALATGDGT